MKRGWRTKVWRISFLRGLLEARTTRLPTNVLSDGVLRAWGCTQLCFGRVIDGFDEKKFMKYCRSLSSSLSSCKSSGQ